MTSSVQQPTRAFSLELPDGFVELPSDPEAVTPEQVQEVTAYFTRLFGLPPDDLDAAAVAVNYAAIGVTASDEGIDSTAMAMYRSPDDPERAMMIMLSSTCLPVAHDDVESAIAGLIQVHSAIDRGEVSELNLPAGRSVVVVSDEENSVTVNEVTLPVLHRKITAWVPDPGGTTVGVVSFASNNWQDWAHICQLAVQILTTMRWDETA